MDKESSLTKEVLMKLLAITASLLLSLSALACPGDKDKEEEKEQRISVIR